MRNRSRKNSEETAQEELIITTTGAATTNINRMEKWDIDNAGACVVPAHCWTLFGFCFVYSDRVGDVDLYRERA